MSALTEALHALCEKHGLSSISLHVSPSNSRPYCFVHWGKEGCTHEYGETIEAALSRTIEKANAARIAAPVVELPAFWDTDDLNDPTECMNTEEYIEHIKAGAP